MNWLHETQCAKHCNIALQISESGSSLPDTAYFSRADLQGGTIVILANG
jgi:hypothetical protein